LESGVQGTVHVVGGGLAGSEAAWQALQLGCRVVLHEMRPKVMTPAHQSGRLAELVCSNSLKSVAEDSAPGLLKLEMLRLDSLVIRSAYKAQVPAGQALAVEREVFSAAIEEALSAHPLFSRVDEEVVRLPAAEELRQSGDVWVVATGPLTSTALASELERLCGDKERLFFYDAIAPVVLADSLDMNHVFRASRWEDGEGDYLNLPLTREEYEAFIDACIAAEKMPLHDFENTKYFEACLPIEVMIERGRETLRFGPMKPSGLTDPRTGRWPWANVQLRMENKAGTMYSMVGFQTKMKWPEQKRVFSMIPALAKAEFVRFGSVHRNTYVQSPKVLSGDLSFRANERIFLAGQVTGVEGYSESAAIGLLAGRAAAARIKNGPIRMPPKSTIIGALCDYVTVGPLGPFQPMNANLGLLPPMERRRGQSKADKKAAQATAARNEFAAWMDV
jgi:methylenetetrahydrofolate--tRNA-(uracil-5-)-methyltransferase